MKALPGVEKSEVVFQTVSVGHQLAVHGVTVPVQVVDTADDGRGICGLAAYGVPTQNVSRVVLLIGHDDFVFVRLVGRDISGIALQSVAPREYAETVRGVGPYDVLRGEDVGLFLRLAEVFPGCGLYVGRRSQFMHQVGHHDAMSFHTHTAWADVAVEQPASVLCRALSGLDMFVSQIFQHQSIRVAQETGRRGVAGDLVVEEHAPVVAVCAKTEADIADLDDADKEMFLEDMGMSEPGSLPASKKYVLGPFTKATPLRRLQV